jgi:hypothetical protein
MGSALPPASTNLKRRPPPDRRALLAISTLLLALLLGPALSALAHPVAATEAGSLQADLSRIAKLVNRGLRPPAQRLAEGLPAAADRIEKLRELASTGQAQIRVALDELRQMSAATTLDPHYLPALVAAGRAYVAVSGQDPVTATTINPDYRGLEVELADNAAKLDGSATEAANLSSRVKRLRRQLTVTRRKARQLERQIQRTPAPEAPPERR